MQQGLLLALVAAFETTRHEAECRRLYTAGSKAAFTTVAVVMQLDAQTALAQAVATAR